MAKVKGNRPDAYYSAVNCGCHSLAVEENEAMFNPRERGWIQSHLPDCDFREDSLFEAHFLYY